MCALDIEKEAFPITADVEDLFFSFAAHRRIEERKDWEINK